MNWDAYWGLAILEADRQQRRAVAAALWAELANFGAKLATGYERLVSTPARDRRLLDFLPLDVSIFDATRSALSSLPSENALTVRHAYRLIVELDQRYAQISASPTALDDIHASDIGLQIAATVEQVRIALHGLRDIAGVTDDQVRAAMAPLIPVLPR